MIPREQCGYCGTTRKVWMGVCDAEPCQETWAAELADADPAPPDPGPDPYGEPDVTTVDTGELT